jgi:hypothetical protein
MNEPLTTGIVAEVLEQLLIALPTTRSKIPLPRLAETYRNGLVGVSGSALRWAAKTSIQEDTYFPKVARLRELATRFEQANRPATGTLASVTTHCQVCHGAYEHQRRWRPMLSDEKNLPVTSYDGVWLMLETFARDVCRCASRCEYRPDDTSPHKDAAMLIATAPPVTIRQAILANPRVAEAVRQHFAPKPVVRGAA